MKITEDTRHNTASMVVCDPWRQRVLLILHNATGAWMFPGGHVDENEAPHEAAVREVLEETGVQVEVIGHGDMLGSDDDVPAILPAGAVRHPEPFMVVEYVAPLKADRPNKEDEPEHRHIDFLYVGTPADRFRRGMLKPQLEEVGAARWFNLGELEHCHTHGETRSEVFGVARALLLP